MAEGGHENPFEPDQGHDNEGHDEWEGLPMRERNQGETPSGRFRPSHGRDGDDEEETSFGGGNETPLIPRERQQEEAWEKIRAMFPEVSSKPHFMVREDYYGRLEVKSTGRINDVWRKVFGADGSLNKKLPAAVKRELGEQAADIIRRNEAKIEENRERINSVRSGDDSIATGEERERVAGALEEENERLEEENEAIGERLPLKERVKEIFKKHGLTVLGIVTAVGIVIGVIVSNLKSGLAKVAKGVGNGLKEIGKKLAGILPAMIGSLVNFLFKAAGEAIGFLAKHAWLLILLVVTFVVEQLKDR